MLKPAKTIEEQITLLKERGIIIDDYDFAKFFLTNNNYYRLMGYAYQFKTEKEVYLENTNFSTIAKIYHFDRSLRQIIYPLVDTHALKYVALTYLNSSFA